MGSFRAVRKNLEMPSHSDLVPSCFCEPGLGFCYVCSYDVEPSLFLLASVIGCPEVGAYLCLGASDMVLVSRSALTWFM